MRFRGRFVSEWRSEEDALKVRPERLILQLKTCRDSRLKCRLWSPWEQEFKANDGEGR